MKRSTIKALEDLKKKQSEVIEIEDLRPLYKEIFGEDSEELKRYTANEYGRKTNKA